MLESLGAKINKIEKKYTERERFFYFGKRTPNALHITFTCNFHTVNIHTSHFSAVLQRHQQKEGFGSKRKKSGGGGGWARFLGSRVAKVANSLQLQLCTLWLYTTFQLLSRSKIVKNRISTFLLLLHRRAIPKCIFPIIFFSFLLFLLLEGRNKKITRSTSNFFTFINHHDYYYFYITSLRYYWKKL